MLCHIVSGLINCLLVVGYVDITGTVAPCPTLGKVVKCTLIIGKNVEDDVLYVLATFLLKILY